MTRNSDRPIPPPPEAMKINEEYRATSNSIFQIVTDHHQADNVARQEKEKNVYKFVSAVYSGYGTQVQPFHYI